MYMRAVPNFGSRVEDAIGAPTTTYKSTAQNSFSLNGQGDTEDATFETIVNFLSTPMVNERELIFETGGSGIGLALFLEQRNLLVVTLCANPPSVDHGKTAGSSAICSSDSS